MTDEYDSDHWRLFAADSKSMGFYEAMEAAAGVGIDVEHVFMHLLETAMCTMRGDYEALLNQGLFFAVTDEDGMEWTFSVIPENGGVITEALAERATEGME